MLITTTKKAATRAEADAILQQSYDLKSPFDTPTFIIRPEYLPDKKALIRKTRKEGLMKAIEILPFCFGYGDADLPVDEKGTKLKTAFRKALVESDVSPSHRIALNHGLRYQRSFCDFLTDPLNSHFNACCQTYYKTDFIKPADHYTASVYKQPVFSLVLAPRQDMTGTAFVGMGNKTKPRQPPPGYASQWQTMALWHEYAHGCGAGEIQADRMSAIICRRAFADQRFIETWSDARAINAMRGAQEADWAIRNPYHWGLVDTIDEVMAMDQGYIDALSENDIKEMRFQKSDNQHLVLHKVSKAIFTEMIVHRLEDNATLFSSTLALLQRGAFKKKEELRIATRFLLACARLTLGESGYNMSDSGLGYHLGRTMKNQRPSPDSI